MKIFIPINENNEKKVKKEELRPLVIEAYLYHVNLSSIEKTQNLLSKKVKRGTETINKGNTRVE